MLFRSLGVPQDEARVRVLGLGSLEYLVLSTGACVCSFLLLARHSGAEQAVTLSWAIGVPAGTALALAALSARGVLYRSRRLEPLLRPALDALEVLGKILVRPRRHGLRALRRPVHRRHPRLQRRRPGGVRGRRVRLHELDPGGRVRPEHWRNGRPVRVLGERRGGHGNRR